MPSDTKRGQIQLLHKEEEADPSPSYRRRGALGDILMEQKVQNQAAAGAGPASGWKNQGPAAEHRKQLTELILAKMKEGKLPWQAPWPKGLTKERPKNYFSGKPYRGMNTVYLGLAPCGDPRWMTYNQAASAGCQVRKGAKGRRIEFWQMKEYVFKEQSTDPETGEISETEVKKLRPVGRCFTVFNAEDVDGAGPYVNELTKDLPEKEIVEKAERLMQATGAKIEYDSPGEAFFDKHTKIIHMSPRHTFNSTYDMYASILHQLAHWTALELKRDLPDITEDADGYMREELRVELACYFLAHDLGVGATEEHLKTHASFIAPWIKMLKLNKNEIFTAAREAEKIYDALMDYAPELRISLKPREETAACETKPLGPANAPETEKKTQEPEPADKTSRVPEPEAKTAPERKQPEAGREEAGKPTRTPEETSAAEAAPVAAPDNRGARRKLKEAAAEVKTDAQPSGDVDFAGISIGNIEATLRKSQEKGRQGKEIDEQVAADTAQIQKQKSKLFAEVDELLESLSI